MKGRVVDINWNVEHIAYVMQGVKSRDQYKFAGFKGGNGTYVVGGEYNSNVEMKVFFYDLEHCINIDVTRQLLSANGRKRISRQLVEAFKTKNVGKKIELLVGSDAYYLPDSEIDYVLQRKDGKNDENNGNVSWN